jgi:hypothetical protein
MLNWKALVLGAIADFAGTYLGTWVLVLIWLGVLKLQGTADETALKAALHGPLFLAVSVTVGWYFDFLGGRVAGLIAKRQGMLHGFAAAFPGVILAFMESAGVEDPMFPPWFMVVCCAISIVCAGYGGAQAVQGLNLEPNQD